jgi:lipoprotein-anchoring transpeptidase ErfK/SrfK
MSVAGLLVVLLALAGGMVVYDSNRNDTIVEGISVGGVDLGGLKRAAAEQRLRDRLLEPLQQPIVARRADKRFTLRPQRAGVTVDIEGSVGRALDRSQEGGILKRTLRGITGGKVDADLDVKIDYNRAAVRSLVHRVTDKLDHPAVDADVDISTTGVKAVQSELGLKVKARALRRTLRETLVSPGADRRFTIAARILKPEVTTKELAKKYPEVIVINRGSFTLQLYRNLKPEKSYRIAVGMAGLETPEGLYKIQDKQVNPYWHVPESSWAGSLAGQVIPPGPSNPIKARWMGIYNGAGIHGTDSVGSIGTAASHGCVRMTIPDVEDLYDRVDVGTPVYVG